MKKTPRELRQMRAELLTQASGLVEKAEAEERDLNEEEQAKFQELQDKAKELEARAVRVENLSGQMEGMDEILEERQAPKTIRNRGDNEIRAIAAYIKRGDSGAVAGLLSKDEENGKNEIRLMLPSMYERRVVDSTMNITTAADGKNVVPLGFVNQIASRMAEISLAERLGVRMVPGTGTTVYFPYDNADAVVFNATSEQDDAHAQVYTRDAPVFGQKAFTLAKKTKKLELTEELLVDEDANLMGFIADHIGRAYGVTKNGLLLTEVAANGTALKTFAAAAAIAAGEPEDIVYSDTLSYYLDDGGSIAWVGRPSTFGNVASLTGNPRLYAETPAGSFQRTLLGYPFYYSNQAAATAASAKDIYFGNWYYVGMREDPALTLLRDPYSVDGLVILKYSFRIVFGVLIAGAIGYGVHPSA